MKNPKTIVNVLSWLFWGIGIAGYLGLSIPLLTSPDAFLYVQGSEAEGGWGFNYAMVIALVLTILGFVLPSE